jgi:hypothetical protein
MNGFKDLNEGILTRLLNNHRSAEQHKGLIDKLRLSEKLWRNVIGNKGSKFTWNDKRTYHNFTRERLDKGVANPIWCEKFGIIDVVAMVVNTNRRA